MIDGQRHESAACHTRVLAFLPADAKAGRTRPADELVVDLDDLDDLDAMLEPEHEQPHPNE